ncbi:MAG TPA: EamA family transporter, partial [Acidimicrobiales bacterium]|nr:EamA family transporter [Acidimicrobiales bacterium]
MNRRGWVLFAVMGVLWGIPYMLIKVAVSQLDPAVLVFFRTVIGAAVLLPLAAWRRELRPVIADWRPMV